LAESDIVCLTKWVVYFEVREKMGHRVIEGEVASITLLKKFNDSEDL
jgi:hypothetical protein